MSLSIVGAVIDAPAGYVEPTALREGDIILSLNLDLVALCIATDAFEGEIGAGALARALLHNDTLRSLDLSDNSAIGAVGVTALADALIGQAGERKLGELLYHCVATARSAVPEVPPPSPAERRHAPERIAAVSRTADCGRIWRPPERAG